MTPSSWAPLSTGLISYTPPHPGRRFCWTHPAVSTSAHLHSTVPWQSCTGVTQRSMHTAGLTGGGLQAQAWAQCPPEWMLGCLEQESQDSAFGLQAHSQGEKGFPHRLRPGRGHSLLSRRPPPPACLLLWPGKRGSIFKVTLEPRRREEGGVRRVWADPISHQRAFSQGPTQAPSGTRLQTQ